MTEDRTRHRTDLSARRLATATSWLAENLPKMANLSREARVMAAVGLLICDECGHFTKAELLSAMNDPECVSAAELLVNAAVS